MVVVRDAKETDLVLIKSIRWEAYQEHESKVPAEHWAVLSNSFDQDYSLTEGVQQMVAEVDGEVVGTVVLFPGKMVAYKDLTSKALEYPELRMLAVSSNCRGKGVAKALVQECIHRSKKQGYHAMGLHTADFMENAIHLYKSLGFQRMKELDFVPLDDGIIVKAFRIYF